MIMWELTKSFRFEAAHALSGTTLGSAAEEIHGHSFRAEVSIRGIPDTTTGMVIDFGAFDRRLSEVRSTLDHKLLNKTEDLGIPTLENISRFIWNQLQDIDGISRVTIYRDSCGESCAYFGPAADI
jgi:6-pyruvoyltetrahydropterin/6-carboxytetrahydropterin synthase